jgi:hypothetical protein
VVLVTVKAVAYRWVDRTAQVNTFEQVPKYILTCAQCLDYLVWLSHNHRLSHNSKAMRRLSTCSVLLPALVLLNLSPPLYHLHVRSLSHNQLALLTPSPL